MIDTEQMYMVTRESGFGQRYKQLPYLDDYGLSEEVVKEYIDKKASIYKKWNERLDEKNMIIRIATMLTIIHPIISYLSGQAWIGIVVFLIYCMGEYVCRKYMTSSCEKEVKVAEIPIIEKYLKDLRTWLNNKK